MKNIHLLPTEKPSRLFNCFGELGIGNCVTTRKDLQVTNQYIYITSDVDIEEGDWCIDDEGIVKCTAHSGAMSHYYSKIILTTDEDLIKDGVQAIDDEFLEWFVKNSSCEKAEIKMENYYASGALQPNLWQYKIIIPKEEPKRKIDTCYNFDMEIGCVQDICRCEQEESNIVRLPPYYESKEESIEDIKLEEVCGSKYCQFSVIENKLEIIYRNQEKLLTAIKLLNNGK
jgi:hypothetical protein